VTSSIGPVSLHNAIEGGKPKAAGQACCSN
jgi:hypothetical protein